MPAYNEILKKYILFSVDRNVTGKIFEWQSTRSSVSAKRGTPPNQTTAEDKNDDLAKEDRVFSTTSCGLKS